MTQEHPITPPPELIVMTELSPAAQAVLDALCVDELNGSQQLVARAHAAAVLRAAADQVVPHSEVVPQQDLESRREAMVWGMVNQTQVIRQQLLAIAAELERGGSADAQHHRARRSLPSRDH